MDVILSRPAEVKDAEKRILALVTAVEKLRQQATKEALENLYEIFAGGAGYVTRV